MENFKSNEARNEIQEKIRKLHSVLQAEMELNEGKRLFNSALDNNKKFNVDSCKDAVDCLNRAA